MIEQATTDYALKPWWGQFSFDLMQARAWQLGSLLLRIQRSSQEWRLQYHRPAAQYDPEQDWQVLQDPHFAMPEPYAVERFLFVQTEAHVLLMPRLADRSVVIKPVEPMYIPAGQTGRLYISTPLWVAGFVAGQKTPLFDIPILQPKETWFGPNERLGVLCYATKVDGHTDLNELHPHAFRAVTPVEVTNHSDHLLRFERMNVPVTALPLFYSHSTGRLWTSQIKVAYDSAERLPRIRLDSRSPQLAGQVEAIHSPRQTASSFYNIFDSFL